MVGGSASKRRRYTRKHAAPANGEGVKNKPVRIRWPLETTTDRGTAPGRSSNCPQFALERALPGQTDERKSQIHTGSSYPHTIFTRSHSPSFLRAAVAPLPCASCASFAVVWHSPLLEPLFRVASVQPLQQSISRGNSSALVHCGLSEPGQCPRPANGGPLRL